ncbi:MAG: phosphotransferase [Acidimicrobiales bacterium]
MTEENPAALAPADVLAQLADIVGSRAVVLGPLAGGYQGGAVLVELGGGTRAVLKAMPWAHPDHLAGIQRAGRVVEHMRAMGYPTPNWLGIGATASHVWYLVEYVDGAPVPELIPSLVAQLVEIVELQAGQATEPEFDHWPYLWRVATGQEEAFNSVAAYSTEVSDLIDRIRESCATVPAPPAGPDMVHGDLSIGNILVRQGRVVGVVDIGSAGSGSRASDLTTLHWYCFSSALDSARGRLASRIADLVGRDGAIVLAGAQITLMLEFPIRHGRHHIVPGVLSRGHQALDELEVRS